MNGIGLFISIPIPGLFISTSILRLRVYMNDISLFISIPIPGLFISTLIPRLRVYT